MRGKIATWEAFSNYSTFPFSCGERLKVRGKEPRWRGRTWLISRPEPRFDAGEERTSHGTENLLTTTKQTDSSKRRC